MIAYEMVLDTTIKYARIVHAKILHLFLILVKFGRNFGQIFIFGDNSVENSISAENSAWDSISALPKPKWENEISVSVIRKEISCFKFRFPFRLPKRKEGGQPSPHSTLDTTLP